MAGRSAVNSKQDGKNFSYFFQGSQYVKIFWEPDGGADHKGSRLAYGPTAFAKHWKSLERAGFRQVDAILSIPGHTNRAYFFGDDSFATIEFTIGSSEKLLNKGLIKDSWQSLVKAGFKRVDAAINVPHTTNQAFFFSGRQFIRVSFKNGASQEDKLLEGPNWISERWSNLGFDTIDTIIPSPTSAARAYVFSGNRAARIILVPGGGVDVDVGPHTVGNYWKALHQAGFFCCQ